MAAARRWRRPRRLGAPVLLLLLRAPGADGKQQLPDLERAKDEMRDPDIVLEGDNTVWMRLPRPFFKEGDPRPHPPREDFADPKVRSRARILVFIASLRETKIVRTLATMFEHAVLPARVYAGIVQQNMEGDPDALEEFCRKLGTPLEIKEAFRGREELHVRQMDEDAWGHGRYTPESLAACEPAARVRMHRMDASEAKGPAYARSQQPRLLSGARAQQDFCLQIDAHTVFVKGWDEHLLDEWAMAKNEYAVLTTYPMSATRNDNGLEPVNDQGRWAMPHLCKATFEGRGVVRNSIAGAVANLQSPALSKFWAAGLSFGRCHAERDVPNDPGLTHIFSGEEFSRAARLWTNGYDMYSMMRPYVFTYYGSDKGGKPGWITNHSELSQAKRRLSVLLGSSPADPGLLKGYDLGSRRRYEDYMKLTGIDTVNSRVTDTPCAVTRWTPWEAGSQPPYGILDDSPARLGVGVMPMEGPGGREGGAEEELTAVASSRESRFLQAPSFAGPHPSGLHLAVALGLPLAALALLLGRRQCQKRSAGKST